MATETRSSGAQADDNGTGSVTWSNPGNAAASDNSYATISGGPGAQSHHLKVTNFGFTTIGDSDTLTQLKIRIERAKSSGGTIKDHHVYLVIGGTIQTGTDYADTSTAYPSSDTYAEYTITSGLPTVAQLKASGFGVAYSCKDTSGFPWGVNCDHIEVVATYTVNNNVTVIPGTASLTLTGFAPTVTATQNQLVKPPALALTLTTFAPNVGTDQTVIPGTAGLTITTFAPTVAITNNVRVIPGTASLFISPFAPTVRLPRIVRPGAAALTLSGFAPNINVQRKWRIQGLTLHGIRR